MEKQQLIHNKWSDLGIILLINKYDFDGWIDVNELEKSHLTNKLIYKEYSESDSGFKTMLCRPKSLQGIENNNGWIKIESEDDLPKLQSEVYVIRNGKIEENTYYVFETKGNNDAQKADWVRLFTHYQPIQKPQPPIY